MAIACSDCGQQNPDSATVCWSCMQPLWEADDNEELLATGESSPSMTAPWSAPYLDAIAGLCWLANTKVVCAAAAVVTTKEGVRVVVTYNSGNAALAFGADEGVRDLVDRNKEVKLETHRRGWAAVLPRKKLAAPVEGDAARLTADAITSACFEASRGIAQPAEAGYCHAELRIVDALFLGAVKATGAVVYIGTSAVCCDNCHNAMLAYNAAAQQVGIEHRIAVFGHHTMKYAAGEWPLPAFMSPESVAKDATRSRFATAARNAFYERVGGEASFRARTKPNEDESAHHRPAWDMTGAVPRKVS